MAVTALPILAPDQVLAALRSLREHQPVKFSAFYSSQLGGIVTDPALMVLPFDDHMVLCEGEEPRPRRITGFTSTTTRANAVYPQPAPPDRCAVTSHTGEDVDCKK